MRTELLAPVGAEESLVAAIQNGANAVYLSGANFGARQFAKNFDEEAMIAAIKYAHIRNVNVYVTVNTLVKDSEFGDVKKYIDFLYTNGVDAIIVQDYGVASYIRSHYPDLELHASTQMSAHSLEDVKYLKSVGFTRVVVAREMSLEEIKEIKASCEIELEVFVHGALCVSYSGQCLMSSLIGGRSGNRGRCAQPCRQQYTLFDQTSYTISPKDLNTVDQIAKLVLAGADSIKIEGRMKGPEYAATVVSSYRAALDNMSTDSDLNRIFNRTYTEGYLFDNNIIASDAPGNRGERVGTVNYYDGNINKLTLDLEKPLAKGDEIQIRREGSSVGARTDVFYFNSQRVKAYDYKKGITVDFKYFAKTGEVVYRTYDADMMAQARLSYNKEMINIPIEIIFMCKFGKPVVMEMSDGVNQVEFSSEILVEKALRVPLDEEKVLKQLEKLGSTPYGLETSHIYVDEGVSIPVKVINELRRQCTDRLDELRSMKYTRESHYEVEFKEHEEEKLKELTVAVRTKEQYDAIKDLDLADIYSMDLSAEGAIFRLPRITPGNDIEVLKESLKDYNGPLLVGNYGQIGSFKQTYLDYSLNVFNQHAIDAYHESGIERLTLSYELGKDELYKLKPNKGQALEVIVYGYAPAMIMSYCPITKQPTHCKSCDEPCKNHHALKDRFDDDYPMIRNGNRIEILNSRRLHLLRVLDDLLMMDIKYFRLDFTIESPEEVRRITEGYINALKGKSAQLTFEDGTPGHFHRGVE